MNISSLSKWKVWVFRFLAVFISIFAALILCEILVRVIAPQDLSGTWSLRTERGGNINKANWTVRHQRRDRTLHYRFNEFHLRGGPIGAGTNRVLVVGDSFTFGWLVEETNTFIFKLNRFAATDFPPNTFEFLNGGTAGWGTADCVAFVEDFAPQIHPAAIVIFLSNDDVERSVRAGLFGFDAANSNSIVPLQHEAIASGVRDRLRNSAIYQWALEHVELAQAIRMAFERKVIQAELNQTIASHGNDDSDFGVRLEKALLLRLQKWCVENHCRLFVLTTGYNAFPDFPLGWDDGRGNRIFFDEATNFLASNHFAFYDLGPEMFAATHGDYKQAVISHDLHPDERGHELMARFAWQWLKPELQEMLIATNRLN